MSSLESRVATLSVLSKRLVCLLAPWRAMSKLDDLKRELKNREEKGKKEEEKADPIIHLSPVSLITGSDFFC